MKEREGGWGQKRDSTYTGQQSATWLVCRCTLEGWRLELVQSSCCCSCRSLSRLMLLATGLVCMHATQTPNDRLIRLLVMGFIVTTLPFWNNKYSTHLMHRAGICHKYCARAFLLGKVPQIIGDGVRGQNALVRSVSLPKKAPLWTHPRFSLSSVHSLWCASRKRSSKTHSALHGL